jgi:hypothetical protein
MIDGAGEARDSLLECFAYHVDNRINQAGECINDVPHIIAQRALVDSISEELRETLSPSQGELQEKLEHESGKLGLLETGEYFYAGICEGIAFILSMNEFIDALYPLGKRLRNNSSPIDETERNTH